MKNEAQKEAESSYAEGAISILTVLKTKTREVKEIFLLPTVKREEKSAAEILRFAAARNIPVSECSEEFYTANSTAKTNGGIMALCSERKMISTDELFSKGHGLVFLLCGIEDPYNFGYAVRSLYAAGAGGMILSPRNWLSAAGVCIRASAGTTELVDCAVYESEETLIASARTHGYKLVCAEEKDASDIFETDLGREEKLFLIIGGEKRGITRTLLKASDYRVRIPYGNAFGMSLTTSASAAVLGFELLRMRRDAKAGKRT